jgi:hypothetical protein
MWKIISNLSEFGICLVPQRDPIKSNNFPKRSVVGCLRRMMRNRRRRVSIC